MIKPLRGRVVQTDWFGNRYYGTSGTKRPFPHTGSDLVSLEDAGNIRSCFIFPARVVEVGYERSGRGHYVILRSRGQRYYVEYFHMRAKATVRKGQLVWPSKVLGQQGRTGNTTGVHLHVTMRNRDKELINPGRYIPGVR